MCVYIYIYLCVCICIHAYVHMCMYKRIHISIHICTYISIRTCKYTHEYLWVCVRWSYKYRRVYNCVYVGEYTGIYVYSTPPRNSGRTRRQRNFSKLPEWRNFPVGKESDQHQPATIEASSQRDVERLLRERSGVRNLRRDFTHPSEKRQKESDLHSLKL